MDLTIGKLNKRVRFESPTIKSPTGSGGGKEQYTEWMNTWAHIRPISGTRSFNEGFSAEATRFDVFVYWRSDIDANIMKETRIIFDNRNCAIDSRIDKEMGGKRIVQFSVTEVH